MVVENIKNFAADVAGMVAERTGLECTVNEVAKNNDTKRIGIIVKSADSNIAPTIYVDEMLEHFDSIEEVVDKVIEVYEEHKMPSLDFDYFTDFSKVKDKIYMVVVNLKANAERFKNIPYRECLDVAFIYKYLVDDNGEMGIASITITNQMLDQWGISVDELDTVARENTQKMFPYTYESMASVIGSSMCMSEEEIEAMSVGFPMMILSNESKINGATAVFYGILKDICNGNDLIIIPSSIHECIIIPITDETEGGLDMYTQMVKEVNASELSADEILSDHIYIYKADTDEIQYDDEE